MVIRECVQNSTPAADWTIAQVDSETADVVCSKCPGVYMSGSAVVHGPATVEQEFEKLATEWKHSTKYQSSPGRIAGHSAYQAIIGMGKDALPLILRDMEQSPGEWFWALRAISRESPVGTEARGDIRAMTDAWLDWGRRRRYI